jgi:transcriptional regulator with XRE-family HTH domain
MPAKTIYSPKYRRLVQSLRDLREKAGLSQSGLSVQLGWPQQRLSAIEAGARRLDIMEFLHLIGALGLSPEEGIRIAAGITEPTPRLLKSKKSAV